MARARTFVDRPHGPLTRAVEAHAAIGDQAATEELEQGRDAAAAELEQRKARRRAQPRTKGGQYE